MASEEKKNNIKEKNEEINNNKELKGIGFFKKLKYSIINIEKYPEMATEGFGKAIAYIAKLVLVLGLILSIWTIYQIYQMIQQGTTYIENEFPEFSYNDGALTVDTDEVINLDNEQFGKIIIDTNTDSEETINQYSNSINETGTGIIILKNRAILKNITMIGEVSYNYKESLDSMNITEFNKQDIVNYVKEGKINTLYLSLFVSILIYSFTMYFVNTLWYAVIISIFGYLTMWILKMRIRYVAVFNMSVYALTLSTILNIIYLLVNIFFNFNIQYFNIMYVTVATIYLLATIFIIKSDLIKKQGEVMKIIEAQEIVKKEMEQKQKEEEKNKQEEKKEKPKDKEEKDKKDNLDNDEPEGSKA